MFSIGEFSKATQLTIKTLRYYHDIGLLHPDHVDDVTGYRSYDEQAFDRVRVIGALKEMGFTLNEMLSILANCKTEREIMHFVENKLSDVNDKLKELRTHQQRLRHFKELVSREPAPTDLVRKETGNPLSVAGIRMQGGFDRMAEGFHEIMKKLGGKITGKPRCLHFDLEFREDDAHFMPCFEVRNPVKADGITCISLEQAPTVSLLHKGPYQAMGKSYAALFRHAHEKNLTVKLPVMERYVRGPGIVFRGNSANYLTEITLFVSV